MEKFKRLFLADSEKLVVGSDNMTTIESIEPPSFSPSKFIVASGIHYITVNDAHVAMDKKDIRKSAYGGQHGVCFANSTQFYFVKKHIPWGFLSGACQEGGF